MFELSFSPAFRSWDNLEAISSLIALRCKGIVGKRKLYRILGR